MPRLSAIAALAFALAALALVTTHRSGGGEHVSLLGGRKVASQQRLLTMFLSGKTGEHSNSVLKMGSGLRKSLENLEVNLEGELFSVRSILEKAAPQGEGEKNAPAGGGEKGQESADSSGGEKEEEGKEEGDDTAWQRKTMQRGALKGESVQKQLERALEHDEDKELTKKTQWRSKDNLLRAFKAAAYVAGHPPLPSPRHFDSGSSAKDANGEEGGDGGVTKITFRRKERGLTAKQYSALVKVLQDAVDKEEEIEQARDRAALDGDEHPIENYSREDAQLTQARPVAEAHSIIMGIPQGSVEYEVQPGDRAAAEARTRGEAWAEREIMRERGEYTTLPRTEERLPLAVEPYWNIQHGAYAHSALLGGGSYPVARVGQYSQYSQM